MTIDRFIIKTPTKQIHCSELSWDLQLIFDDIRNTPSKHAEFFAVLVKRGIV